MIVGSPFLYSGLLVLIQSCSELSTCFSGLGGLGVKALVLINHSLYVLQFIHVFDIHLYRTWCSDGFVGDVDIYGRVIVLVDL